jgi:hypothetical protein
MPWRRIATRPTSRPRKAAATAPASRPSSGVQPCALDEPAGDVGGEAEEGGMAEGQQAGEAEQQVEGAGEQREAQQLHHEHRVQADDRRQQRQASSTCRR